MVNKYQSINDPILLKKPRKQIVPMGQDLSQFETTNANLKLMANFGMEMLKFLPKFEQLIYAGKMKGEEGLEDSVEMKYKQYNNVSKSYEDASMWVTKEWYEAFNQYDLSKMGFTAEEINKIFGERDYNGDWNVNAADAAYRPNTNKESIDQYQQMTGKAGFDQRFGWIFGQHHRVGDFGNFGSDEGMGFAGAGTGKNFKNIDFDVTASEFDHIAFPRGTALDVTTASSNAYYINDILGKFGKSMSDVENMLQDKFPGQSFYDIVISGDYKKKNLTQQESFLLIAGMFESRERGWDMMSKAYGAVDKTRNDQALISWLDNSKDSLINSTNSYLDHHELSLFPFFLYIQHSVQNQMTMFYEKYQDTDRGDGFNNSVLDKYMFRDFVVWAGREQYDKDNNIKKLDGSVNDIDGGGINKGILYEYRDSLSGDQKGAVQKLIDGWFGATELKNKKPTWEGYTDVTDGGSWKALSNFGQATVINSGTGWVDRTITHVYVPNIKEKGYAWDRKWAEGGIKVKYLEGSEVLEGRMTSDAVNAGPNRFLEIFKEAYGDQATFNPRMGKLIHYNYLAPQFTGLNFSSTTRGQDYNTNWAVHAIGNYLKNGEGKDILGVMEKIEKRRSASVEFKKDSKDYVERKQELEDEKAREEAEAARARAQAQARNKPKKPLTMAEGGAAQTDADRKAYEAKLQSNRQRILRSSAKRKAYLKKATQGE